MEWRPDKSFERYAALQASGSLEDYWAGRFSYLRDRYRREDGSPWSGLAIERATGGLASRHFISDLTRRRIKDPGILKMWAISRAMGFPISEWFD